MTLDPFYDAVANETTQVELQWDGDSTIRLYINQHGVTVVRMCKLKPENIWLPPSIRDLLKSRHGL